MVPILTSEEPIEFEDRKDSLVGKIAADVARAISNGTLAPGDELNSVDLAARFGTSRTPVREALMLLEKEGLVEIRRGGGRASPGSSSRRSRTSTRSARC